MSKSIKLLALFGFVATLSACAQERLYDVVVIPDPISSEQTFTSKYK